LIWKVIKLPKEVVMGYEICADSKGKPILKKRLTFHTGGRSRGIWVEIGRVDHTGIERFVEINRRQGLLVLPDENGFYRALILTN
jgi:hypothetical protein